MPARSKRPPENWYAVHTKARCEALAAGRLWQRYPVFLPRVRRVVRHARQTETRLCPALPRYLFVRMPASAAGIVNRDESER